MNFHIHCRIDGTKRERLTLLFIRNLFGVEFIVWLTIILTSLLLLFGSSESLRATENVMKTRFLSVHYFPPHEPSLKVLSISHEIKRMNTWQRFYTSLLFSKTHWMTNFPEMHFFCLNGNCGKSSPRMMFNGCYRQFSLSQAHTHHCPLALSHPALVHIEILSCHWTSAAAVSLPVWKGKWDKC